MIMIDISQASMVYYYHNCAVNVSILQFNVTM